MKTERELFLYELDGHGYTFENMTWLGNCFEDDMLNMAWEMWSSAKHSVKAQAVPKWISVNDQMPPIDETVLVCWDHAQDIEPEKEYVTTDENLDEYWPNCQDEPPTHWMPLPKVIEAQEQSYD